MSENFYINGAHLKVQITDSESYELVKELLLSYTVQEGSSEQKDEFTKDYLYELTKASEADLKYTIQELMSELGYTKLYVDIFNTFDELLLSEVVKTKDCIIDLIELINKTEI